MKGEDDTMAKLSITKLEVNTPNPNNPCSHSFSCAVVVEGVVNDETLREAVDMVCEALRKQLPDEEKAGATAEPEGTTPNADKDTNGPVDEELNDLTSGEFNDGSVVMGEVTSTAAKNLCDLAFLKALADSYSLPGDSEAYNEMGQFLWDLAGVLGVHDEPNISQLPTVARVICRYFNISGKQTPECDGKGNCGGECHCHGKPTVEEEAWMEEQYRKAAAGMKPGDSADNVRKWMDEAPDGDGSTASGEEDADDQAGRRETAAQRVLPQRQYVHVSLPGGGHISLPEDYVFFGPSRVLENLF